MKKPLAVARLAGALLALGALLRGVPSCTTESIVLATVSATHAGKPPALSATPCNDNSDCKEPTFCSKTSCSATTGTCEVPTVCTGDESFSPECACTNGLAPGVTYFNDCVRQQAFEPSYTAGPCSPPDEVTLCEDGYPPCASGQSCAQLGFKGACQTSFPGTCWVLPSTCPTPPPGADRWDSCTTSDTCVDTCTAIATGGPYRHSVGNECLAPPGGP
jgi:hypothetical protein